jgi:uncharacterized protein
METIKKTAFITGATSGIGKEFACRYAAKGYDLIITGRRRPELSRVAKAIASGYNVKVIVLIGDMSNCQFRIKLCRRIMEAGNVEVLVNNAGFGIDHAFHMTGIDGIRSMVDTHAMAIVELTHAVLPGMISRRSGTIINVSSLGAFIPGFTRSIYVGTKSFVHYFSEALSTEISRFGIRVQSLCPGMTETDFHREICDPERKKQMHLLPFMSPEKVVSISLRSLEKGWLFCIPGARNRMLYVMAKILPTRVLMHLAGRQAEHTPELKSEVPVPSLVPHDMKTPHLRRA